MHRLTAAASGSKIQSIQRGSTGKTCCDGMGIAQRWQWLGEEMYGVWSGGCQAKR